MVVKQLLLTFASLGIAVTASADLQWDDPAQKAQSSPDGQFAEFHFTFRNTGKTSVTINNIHPSCDCTTAKLDKKTYAPGEKGVIEAKVNYYGRAGTHHRMLAVFSDDNRGQPKTLDMVVEVVEPLAVRPQLVFWRVGEKNDARTVELTANKDHPVKVNDVKSSNPRITARLTTVREGEQYVIDVSPESTAEPQAGELTIQTEYPAGTPHSYKVQVRVK
jgi:hypothetical protein